jgi:hypothetical protein
MSRKGLPVLIALVVLVLAVVPVYAGLHFVGGGSIGGGSLIASVTIAGFGNSTDSVEVTLDVSGDNLTAWCQNRGGKVAPGQNPVSVAISATQTVGANKNGSSTADFHVDLVADVTASEGGCPNENWSVVDLTGYLRVLFVANNFSTGEQAELKLDCYYNEPFKQVDCQPASGW